MDKKTKVLIAEDDKFLSKLLEKKLGMEGYSVMIAYDGKESLEMCKKDPPDIILLDLIVPNMNGFEFLDAIKKDSKLKSIPVIIFSNLGQDDDVKKGLAAGAKDYVIKANISINDIVAKIEKYL